MSSIRLSPKHGLNPTIPVCFFCGQEKNELVLLGKMPAKKHTANTAWGTKSTVVDDPDPKAPMHAVIDYEPCDACKQAMARGNALIGVVDHPRADGQPPIASDGRQDLYPTGQFMVINDHGIQGIFQKSAAQTILKNKKALVPQELLDELDKQLATQEEEK